MPPVQGKQSRVSGVQGVDFANTDATLACEIEDGGAVPWTMPEGIRYGTEQPLPPLATVFKKGFRFAWSDGSVSFLPKDTREPTLRAIITRNGGEILGPDARSW